MKITIKLKQASYTIYIEGICLTLDCTHMGTDKKNNEPKEVTYNVGYYGPGQVDLAINRIIAEELTHHEEKVNLREFLRVYKGIHEIINPQVAELKTAIKENRLQTT